jgi:uncharacterized membrane protein YraQ (UPF0718 family)/copper chaperone CopZ
MKEFFYSLWVLVLEMAPYLLLGFFIAGLLYAFVPQKLYAKHLQKPGFKSVLYSTLLGIPLPLCSCGVLPTTVSLRKSGASRGACTSFLISTPQTGVDSILATYSLLGLPFAIIRPIAALVTGLVGGFVTDLSFKDEKATDVVSKNVENKNLTFMQKLKVALQYAFGELLEDVGKWLVIGLLVSALITVAVPNDFFSALQDYPFLNMLIVLVIAIPMYTCATGSIPIALSLMMKGMTPGAAFLLLMAGPAINTASMLVINKAFGKKQTVIYIVSIVLGAITFGLVMDYLLPSSWFDVSHMNAAIACCEEGHNEWFSIICSVVFLILLIKSFFHGHHHHGECGCGCHDGGCHCHDHDDEEHCHCHEDDDDDDCCCCDENSEMVLKVKGMCCSHCANNLRDAFLANDEIDSCEVDHNSGFVNIKFKEGRKMTKEQLAAVVDGLGYEVVDE